MLVTRVAILFILFLCSAHSQNLPGGGVDDLCLDCICQASTGCTNKPCAAVDGQTFCGPYLISMLYWIDAGKPGGSFEQCATDKLCAEETVKRYVLRYARNCNRDTVLDCEDIALLHKAGPFACESANVEATPYWKAFLTCYFGKKK